MATKTYVKAAASSMNNSFAVESECSPPAEGKEKKRLGPSRDDDPPKDEKSSEREKQWKA